MGVRNLGNTPKLDQWQKEAGHWKAQYFRFLKLCKTKNILNTKAIMQMSANSKAKNTDLQQRLEACKQIKNVAGTGRSDAKKN